MAGVHGSLPDHSAPGARQWARYVLHEPPHALGGKWAAKHGVWHYRTAVTAIASIAGMMLHCGE